ncbi:site-specific DNA-methyltransferase [Paenibacillus crassostreae]|uniref:Methyltransferase n=1 Tax=Paenibacillus crassostreae TaxID=1763538 RepID=A0A167AUI8_9BACL|nr:site-specific DNA-methyltransferase [Paenibacillus crassostreae]AOZ93618.1 DNA modification methylase [Paenibacillus crassostreae]OAB71445.1 lactate dehydrogenase [Paenibacillus crassostreae]
MEFIKLKIDQLVHADYNPRKDLKAGDPEFEKIRKSIEEFGYCEPIICNRDYTIVGGHQRHKVLKALGYEEVDCVLIDVDKTKEKALNIALNKITGEWDFDALAGLLDELKQEEYNIELTGFDFSEAEKLFDEFNKDDESDEDDFDVDDALSENPITLRGDIWLLGKHRLVCGDSTNEQDMATLMDGKKARLIVTDPPYNVDYTGKTKDALKIENDKMDNEQFYGFLLAAYKRMYEVADDGASIYVFHADSEGLNFRMAFRDAGFKLTQCCIWAKSSMCLGRQSYHWKHEPILYGNKPTYKKYWNSDRKQTTLWEFDKPFRNEFHPTMKPIPLITYPIKNSSKIGDIVLDSFGGSGSTLIACEDTDRICYTMELDEKYADVIVKRYISHVGSDTGVYLIRDNVKYPYQEVNSLNGIHKQQISLITMQI